MKSISQLILVSLLTTWAASAGAQSSSGEPPKLNLKSRSGEEAAGLAAQAAERLKAASESGGLEKARLAAEELMKNEKDLAGKAKEAAASLMKKADVNEEELREQGEAAMKAAMKNLSSEGKALLDSENGTAAPSGAMPKPLQPLEEPTVKTPAGKVTIMARDSAYLDNNSAIAIFVGDVKVYHPQFYLECEELELHMEKDAMEAKSEDPASSSDAILAKPKSGGSSADETGGIKMAIAKGPQVLIRKLSDTGEVQVANCKEATFVSATGEMTLRVWPQVQRGQSLQIASDSGTIMILNKDGGLRTVGPSRTEIVPPDSSPDASIPSAPLGDR